MKLLIILLLTMAVGCFIEPDVNAGNVDAAEFYVKIIESGEQTEELDKLYQELKNYGEDSELIYNLLKMYEALGDSELSVELYRIEVTRLLNE